jgi:hypothetical protein
VRLLEARGIVVPDLPPEWRYGVPSYAEIRENAARLSFEMGLGDRVAWEAGFEAPESWETRVYGLRLALAEQRRRRKGAA